MNRPNWHQYHMGMAKAAATRSSCPRLSVGVVLIRPESNTIIVSGYNGAPPGASQCNTVGCLMHDDHCIRANHGEHNALLTAERELLPTQGSTVYCQYSSCPPCATRLIAAGVKVAVFESLYRGSSGVLALLDAGVTVLQLAQDDTAKAITAEDVA